MKKTPYFTLIVFVLLTISPLQANSIDLIGKWVQVENDQYGFKNILNFKENEKFELHYSSVIESKYKIENDILVVTGLTPVADPLVNKYIFHISNNQMLLQRVTSEKPLALSDSLELVRISKTKSTVSDSIVGKWIVLKEDLPQMTYEYTKDGIWLSNLNSNFFSGSCLVKDNNIILLPTNKKAQKYKLAYEQDILTLVGNDSNKVSYKKLK